MAMNFDLITPLADALLYEGYLLYPYRSTALKNQRRFSFGCLLPPSFPQPANSAEVPEVQAECLLVGTNRTQVTVQARFLHLLSHKNRTAKTWGEAIPRDVTTNV